MIKPISELIKSGEYSFLHENEHLKGRLIFLAYGGSIAYGTNTPESDIDIRGCAFNSKSDLIGMSNFDEVVRNEPDTTIYSFNKLISLLINVNPNTCELLGCKPEHRMICHPVAQEMIDNQKMFLSQRAKKSFSGYALQQLRRLQNAVGRERGTDEMKRTHAIDSIKNAWSTIGGIAERHLFDEDQFEFSFDDENKLRIGIDRSQDGFDTIRLCSALSEVNNIVKSYDKLNHRNNKKSDYGLNKHAMHLLRLYLMALDIFEQEKIITYRENDLELLMSVRNGKYMNE
ncbi:MAG: nucleotidyltransferase domain-containing protein, partial [Oscillospiraceae bacterium]|nr:nucleotidyltransferase domain-containing protein [Oscillospiraceae bacterium]